MRRLPLAMLSVCISLSFCSVQPLHALTSDRSGHLFTQDEEYIVLNTTLANGTNANWTLTNLLYNNESITGTAVVQNGQVRIPTRGLLASEYTFAVAGDGSINGGLLPPLFDYHAELTPFVMCLFTDDQIVNNCRIAWENSFERTREPYMWRQLGMREVRVEFRFEEVNPSAGNFTWEPNRETYFTLLRDNFVRPTIKIVGSQSWNGNIRNYPTSMANWRSGLLGIAQRYHPLGIDKYYMVGRADEQSWWWDTTQVNADAKYVDFVNNTNDVLKTVDPGIIFVAPENWSYDWQFTDLLLSSATFDIFSADFPCDTMDAMYAHSGLTFREMAKLNKWKPFVNTEEGGRIHNWAANADSKFYTGLANQQITGCMDTSILVQYDLNCLNGVFMLEDWSGMYEPFENRLDNLTTHMTVVAEQCWQTRVAADALAGAHLMKRVPGVPPNTVAYIYRRGNDRFVGAYTSEARVGQLAEFTTSRSSLTMVDAFGNRYTLVPTAGKVRILFTNLITFVHGLADDDTIAFIPNSANETPRILNPGTLTATVGREFRYRVDGYDPDPSLLRWASRYWTWSLQSPPAGMTIGAASGLIRWTPTTPGPQSVTVRLQDGDGANVTQTFSINVLAAGSNVAPEIISWPSPVAVKGKRYIYVPRAYDVNGDNVTFTVNGPSGMTYTASSVTWTPTATGMFNVTVTANDGNGGTASQSFTIQVQNSPERPADGERLPRGCQYLTVTSLSGGVTLVWNKYTNCDSVVQRSASRNGPWTDIATTPNTWYRDTAPPATAFYRVVARNSAGDAEPSNVVNGRNRAPIAVAGRSTKNAGTVTLDGTGSYDPDNSGTLTYQWRVVCAPHGVTPTLTNANSATASFSGPNGLYVIELVVSDGEEVSEPDFVRVCSGASAMEPVGDLGAPRFVTAGSTTVSITAWRSGGDNTFWRLDDLPLGGYQQFQFKRQNNLTNTISNLTVPGVYLVQFVPTDQWVAGFIDFGKIIVSPPVSGDTTPPAAVNDLAAGNPTDTSIRLTWTAPGNDGTSGTAAQYDIRYSPTAITNDATFSAALQCVGEPAPQAAGSSQNFTVSGLTPGTRYWFALKTVDGAGNWSALSNVTTGQTTGTAPSVPPVVSLTSPVNGSTYTAPANITLAATASDSDGSIARVEFWTGATLLNSDTSSPYSYSWTGVAAGGYALRAIAYDNTNTTSTSAIVNITVNPPPNQPHGGD
jgi:chitodextrinase